jgi:hypothetical protein
VVGVRAVPCGLGVGRDDCLEVSAELRSGPDEGDEVTFTFAAAEGEFDVGDDLRVFKNAPVEAPPDTLGEGIEIEPYSFSDFERRTPMLGLVVMFAALVLLTMRPWPAGWGSGTARRSVRDRVKGAPERRRRVRPLGRRQRAPRTLRLPRAVRSSTGVPWRRVVDSTQ